MIVCVLVTNISMGQVPNPFFQPRAIFLLLDLVNKNFQLDYHKINRADQALVRSAFVNP